nr:MAG TPA: hypothetical protein [Bacteriophage sp.]
MVPLRTPGRQASVPSARVYTCLPPIQRLVSGRFLVSYLSLQINNRGKKVK